MMPRYKIAKIPAGCTFSLMGGVQREREEWKARRLPQQWAVLDTQWRVWDAAGKKWFYYPFPWVIAGNFNSCMEWMEEHKFDGDVRE